LDCQPLSPEEIKVFMPLFVLGFAVILSPLLYLGIRLMFYPEKILNFNKKMAQKMYDGLGMVPPGGTIDKYDSFNYPLYQFVGFSFIAMYICPLLLILYSTWDMIYNGGTVYVGCMPSN
jgi:hypothetical protein